MPDYKLKPLPVQVMRIAYPTVVNMPTAVIHGEPGDYMVQEEVGLLETMVSFVKPDAFKELYEPQTIMIVETGDPLPPPTPVEVPA